MPKTEIAGAPRRLARLPLDRVAFHLLLIVATGLLAYHGSFRVPFYFDDFPCIVENPVVHDLDNLARLGDYRQLGITEDIRNNIVTRIVTYLSFAANYQLHGLGVIGYHVVNLLIHLFNAALVYFLVRLLRTPRWPGAAGSGDPLALVVALLFVAHPLQTNAVTYIVQRFAALATLFCLAALLTYLQAYHAKTPHRRRLLYASALLATVAAMFTKEIAYPLPLLIALFDLIFLPGDRRQRLRRLAPFCATLTLLPITIMVLAAASEVTLGRAANALELVNIGGGSRWSYFLTQWQVLVIYLRLLLLPTGLHLEYDLPRTTSLANPTVVASGLLLAALLGLGLWLLLSRRAGHQNLLRLAGLGIVWFFLTLAMESSIIPLDDLLFEYRLYLPSIGFFLAAGCGAELLRCVLVDRWSAVNGIALCAAALLVAALACATIQRNRTWQDNLAFWQDNVAKSPHRARSRCSLAIAYRQRGDFARAIVELETAGSINPSYWPAFESLGDLRWDLGLYRLAADDYAKALRAGNRSREMLLKLGRAQRRSGDLDAARATIFKLLAIDPEDREGLAELQSLPR